MFFIPHSTAKRAIVVVATVSATVVVARAFPHEVEHLAHGFREGCMTLLIEHILHNWGVIVTGAASMLVHTFRGD